VVGTDGKGSSQDDICERLHDVSEADEDEEEFENVV